MNNVIFIGDIVKHESGIVGKVVENYKPTGGEWTIKILTNDGRQYYAPESEFIKVRWDSRMDERNRHC